LRRIKAQDPFPQSARAIFVARLVIELSQLSENRHVPRVARLRLPQQLGRALTQAGLLSRYSRMS
jgi:hypothetical protein